jgi:hypothetical protein
MVAKKQYPCPSPTCNKVMKSTSGWTLHVKKCCPELRWRKTIVKMEIEFEIPDVTKEGLGPVDLFRQAFWEQDVRGIGSCKLTQATLLDVTTATRDATQREKNRIARAEALRDRGTATREFKRIVQEIIGKPNNQGVHTETRWPEQITVTYHNPGLNKWEKRSIWDVAFVLHLKTERLEVKLARKLRRGGQQTPWGGSPGDYTGGKAKTFRLADPNSFEDIRNYTGLRP